MQEGQVSILYLQEPSMAESALGGNEEKWAPREISMTFLHAYKHKFHPYLTPEVAQLQALFGVKLLTLLQHTWLGLFRCTTQNKQGKTRQVFLLECAMN